MPEQQYDVAPLVNFEWVEEDGETLLLFTIEDFVEGEGYQVFLGEDEALVLLMYLKKRLEPLVN